MAIREHLRGGVDEFIHRSRLHDVVGGPVAERFAFVVFAVGSGKNDLGHLLIARLIVESDQSLQTVHDRHVHIEHNQTWSGSFISQRIENFLAIVDHFNVITVCKLRYS